MPSYPFIHSYARFFLKENNLRIKNNGKTLFDSNNPPLPPESYLPDYFYTKYSNPILKTGTFKKSNSIKQLTSYQDLKDYGFIINSYAVSDSNRKIYGQRAEYRIRPIEFCGDDTLNNIPKEHQVLHDTINKAFCLKGKNSDNRWVYMETKKETKKKLSFSDELRLARGLPIRYEADTKNVEIEGIPIGISWDEWKLVCIPPWKNPFVAGYVGKRGKSKSIGLHMTNDFLFNMGHNCCFLNDWKYETHTWNQPMQGADFVNRLNYIGLKPKPLPTVYFTPGTRIMEKNLMGKDENIGEIISLSFKNLIRHYNEFFSSFKEFDLGKSKRMFDEKIIENCKTREDVIEVLDKINDKQFKQVKDKLMSTMQFLFDQDVCDINTKFPSSLHMEKVLNEKVIYKTENLPSIVTAMIAGLFPIFIPRSLLSVKFGKSSILPSYINNLVQSIYDIKDKTKYFEKKEIYISIDELNTITEKGVNQAITDIANLGRTSGIGMLWATQNYSKVLEDVRINTEFLFCMQYDNTNEINTICNNYDAKNYVKEEIKQLSKEIPHECFVFPSSRLLTYDLSTGEKEYIDEPIKIQLTPPLSKHSMSGGLNI